MRRLPKRIAAAAPAVVVATLCAAACAAAAQKPAPASALDPRPPEAGIGNFASRLVAVEDDLIARVYAQTLRERFADHENSEAHVRSLLSSPQTIGGSPVYASARIEQGEFAGQWSFEAPGGGLPTRAWRNIDRSGAQGYDAERVGYCRGPAADCVAWFEAKRHRSAPPDGMHGELAPQQWRQRVLREPCTPVAPYRPSVAPLQAAVGRAGMPMTRAILQLLHNRCGEVRQVRIVQSSRHRDVDRALMTWAYRLVVARPDHEANGFYSHLPFDLLSLSITDDPADASAPAKPTSP